MSFTIWRVVRSERLYDDYVHFWRKRTADRSETSKSRAVRVMEEEWDYLVILDACRLDLFREVVDPQCPSVLSGGRIDSAREFPIA